MSGVSLASKAREASSSGGGGRDGQRKGRGGKHDSGYKRNDSDDSDDSVDDDDLSNTQLPLRRTLTGSISVSTRGMGGDFAESKIAPDGSIMTLALVTTDQVRFFWATAVRVLLFFVCPPLFFFPLWRDFARHGKGTMFQLGFFHLGALCWPVLATSLWYTYASPVDVGNEPTYDGAGEGPPMYGDASTTGSPTEETAHGRVTSRMMLQEILFTSSLPAYVTAALFCVAKASFGYTHRADCAGGDSGGDGNSGGTSTRSSADVVDCRGGSEDAAPTQTVGAAASRFLLKYVLTEEYQIRGRARTPCGLIAWWMLFSRFLASPYIVVGLWEMVVMVVKNRARSEQLDLGAGEHASCGVAGGVSIACGGFCVMQQRCQPAQEGGGLPPPPSSPPSFSISSVSLQAIVATFADMGDGSSGSDGGGGIGGSGEDGSTPGVNALWMWLTLLAVQQIAIGHIIFLCLESIHLYKLRLRSQRRFNRQTEDAPVRRPNDCGGGDGEKGDNGRGGNVGGNGGGVDENNENNEKEHMKTEEKETNTKKGEKGEEDEDEDSLALYHTEGVRSWLEAHDFVRGYGGERTRSLSVITTLVLVIFLAGAAPLIYLHLSGNAVHLLSGGGVRLLITLGLCAFLGGRLAAEGGALSALREDQVRIFEREREREREKERSR